MSSPSKRPGHPDTRRQILQATWEAFDERRGDVRVQDVADRAGVSRQAVYLHFGDRRGLLVALVEYINARLGLGELERHVAGAVNGEKAIERLVSGVIMFTARLDSITAVFEARKQQDEGLSAAWRNRMEWRRRSFRAVFARLEAEGKLAEGWRPDAAADLAFALTLPSPVRELTAESGWQASEYAKRVVALLRRGLIGA